MLLGIHLGFPFGDFFFDGILRLNANQLLSIRDKTLQKIACLDNLDFLDIGIRVTIFWHFMLWQFLSTKYLLIPGSL